MAKKINLKAEKAKRNQEYALQFKKKRRPVARTIEPLAPRAMANGHEAVCNTCGTQTTVPFKPTPGRTVLCRPCFDRAA